MQKHVFACLNISFLLEVNFSYLSSKGKCRRSWISSAVSFLYVRKNIPKYSHIRNWNKWKNRCSVKSAQLKLINNFLVQVIKMKTKSYVQIKGTAVPLFTKNPKKLMQTSLP